MAFAMTAIAGASLVGGLLSSNKAAKQQKQALNLQRDQLAYAKQKDAENKALYGGVTQQVIDQAAAGVTPNLTQVSNEAATDAKTAFAGAQGALERNQQRMGINPNSGRAESQLQDAQLSEALAQAGGVTNARQTERNNAATETYNHRLQVAQMGTGQQNISQANVINAGNGVANTLNQGAAQSSADAAGFANAAVNFGLKAYDKYNAPTTPSPVPSTYPALTGALNPPSWNTSAPTSSTSSTLNVQPISFGSLVPR